MTESTIAGWFAGRVPGDWFTGPPEVDVDRDEILVRGRLAEPDVGSGDADAQRAARRARMQGYREDTRQARMRIADEAEARFGRKVSWAARCGDDEAVFTSVAAPVMTRLRIGERRTLDTLVDAGVARSRSEALAWCVRLVREHQGEWIDQLREALTHVEAVRAEGPDAG